MTKTAEQLNRQRHVQAIRKDHGLCFWINPVFFIMVKKSITPIKRVATVMTSPIEELAEVEVKVAQERIHAVDIG